MTATPKTEAAMSSDKLVTKKKETNCLNQKKKKKSNMNGCLKLARNISPLKVLLIL
jgi:hypothetical protein